MHGYYHLPEKTAEVMSADGWFRTGDIGMLDAEGFLAITDRKKDLIKTSGGKYIAPQPIENEIKTSRYVSQAVVVGNKRKYASVLIVPNFENLTSWARAQGLSTEDPQALLAEPAVAELYDEVLEKVNAHRPSYETIKKVGLVPHDFTIDAGELTPTLKVKRGKIEEKYSALIDTLYEPEMPASRN
jgi:long-chain acyl-CoA synthetase